jgi:hypothetical protein
MSIPARPRFQPQNPAISGYKLGWLSCTAYACAMGIDKATLGKKRPSGKDVRIQTGDTTGGLTLPQVARVADTEYGVKVEVHVGGSTATPSYAISQLKAGRGMLLQGNTKALLGTTYRSTTGAVNHAVYVNEVRADGDALVYDPAADARRAGIDQGPTWWPWAVVLRFAAALRPWGDTDPRVLGPGRMYAGFYPDTEPHVHLRSGARRTDPFPDRCRAWNANPRRRINVRSGPSVTSPIIDTLAVGELFTAYQIVQGGVVDGDRTWYGNHDGNGWVHRSGLRSIGGTS